jgi:hypothetical protein
MQRHIDDASSDDDDVVVVQNSKHFKPIRAAHVNPTVGNSTDPAVKSAAGNSTDPAVKSAAGNSTDSVVKSAAGKSTDSVVKPAAGKSTDSVVKPAAGKSTDSVVKPAAGKSTDSVVNPAAGQSVPSSVVSNPSNVVDTRARPPTASGPQFIQGVRIQPNVRTPSRDGSRLTSSSTFTYASPGLQNPAPPVPMSKALIALFGELDEATLLLLEDFFAAMIKDGDEELAQGLVHLSARMQNAVDNYSAILEQYKLMSHRLETMFNDNVVLERLRSEACAENAVLKVFIRVFFP